MTSHDYDDIIHLPHHVSQKRPQMPLHDRAAQFAPFAALTGFDAEISETARRTEYESELDDNIKTIINERLQILCEYLSSAPEITVTYFKPDERKAGGSYVECTGVVRKIDQYLQKLMMADGTKINFDDIYYLEGDLFSAFT